MKGCWVGWVGWVVVRWLVIQPAGEEPHPAVLVEVVPLVVVVSFAQSPANHDHVENTPPPWALKAWSDGA